MKVEVGVGERCLVAGRKEVVWLKVGNWANKKVNGFLFFFVFQGARFGEGETERRRGEISVASNSERSSSLPSFLLSHRSPIQP